MSGPSHRDVGSLTTRIRSIYLSLLQGAHLCRGQGGRAQGGSLEPQVDRARRLHANPNPNRLTLTLTLTPTLTLRNPNPNPINPDPNPDPNPNPNNKP